jgi:hypothetical protein
MRAKPPLAMCTESGRDDVAIAHEAVEQDAVPGLNRLRVVAYVAYLGWPRAQGGVLPAVAPAASCGVTM